MVIGLTLNSNCRDNYVYNITKAFNEALAFNKVDGKNLRYTQSFVTSLEDNYQFYSSPE